MLRVFGTEKRKLLILKKIFTKYKAYCFEIVNNLPALYTNSSFNYIHIQNLRAIVILYSMWVAKISFQTINYFTTLHSTHELSIFCSCSLGYKL